MSLPKVCTVEGCEKPRVNRRVICAMHLWRMKTHGTYDLARTTDIERFHASYDEDEASGCWVWQRSLYPDVGYARFSAGGVTYRAHKWGYRNLVGEVPDGLVLDHLCRNRACVNPDHLEPVTNRENVIRGMSEPAVTHRRQVCRRGHPVTDENLYIPPSRPGQRACAECRRINVRAYRARKAAG